MSLKKRLIETDIFIGPNVGTGHTFYHSVDKQKGISVRQQIENTANIHHLRGRGVLTHSDLQKYFDPQSAFILPTDSVTGGQEPCGLPPVKGEASDAKT